MKKILIFSLIVFVFCLSIVFAAQIEKKNLLVNTMKDTTDIDTKIVSVDINTTENYKNIGSEEVKKDSYISKPTSVTKPNENKCSEGYSSFIISIKKGDNFISFPQGTELKYELKKELLSKATFYEYSKNEYSIVKELKANNGYIVKSNENFEISLCKTCENEDYVFELNNGAGWYLIPGPYSIQKTDLIAKQVNSGPYILNENGKYQSISALEPGASYWIYVNDETLKQNNAELRIDNVCARERPTTTHYIYDCTTITEPGYYELANDINADLNSSEICINIFSDDVYINCNNHFISGTETGQGFKTASRDSSGWRNGVNISIENCNIYGFEVGINLFAKNSSILNNKIKNSTKYGIVNQQLDKFENILFKNNSIDNSGEIGIYFFMVDEDEIRNVSLIDNKFCNNTADIGLSDRINIIESNLQFIHNSCDSSPIGEFIFGSSHSRDLLCDSYCESSPADTNLTGLLIYDLIDNDWADRDLDKVGCIMGDSCENYNPFTDGVSGDTTRLRRYGEEEIDGLDDYSFSIGGIDDFTETQNIWIKGQSMYETDGPPYLDIDLVAYSVKFIQEGTGEEIGIPVCQDDDGTDDWSYCVRTGTENYDEETIRLRPQIKFLGDRWTLLDLQPPAEGGSQANENFREFGGEITLVKDQAAYGIISVGEQLTTEDHYVQLDDISVGTGHPAIVSLYYSNGTFIEQDMINPGETTDMGPSDEISVHVYQTAYGITPTSKWAEISILSDILVLEDGDSVDDDENEDWNVRLAWKNKEGDTSLTSDSLREIILYNDDYFKLTESETFNIIEDPRAFEFSFPGFLIGNTTKLIFDFDDSDLVECGTGAILNPSREDQMWAHITTESTFGIPSGTGYNISQIFVGLKDGIITGTTSTTLDFKDIWFYNDTGDCVIEIRDAGTSSCFFYYYPAGDFGALHIGGYFSYYPEVIQFTLDESIGPVSSIEGKGVFSFIVYNETGDWQYQIDPLDDENHAQYTVNGFAPSSDSLPDLNLEVEDNFVSLRGTKCDFSNDKYEFEIPGEVVTLEPSIEPIIPEDEPSESPCTIRRKSATLEITAGPMTEEIELNEGETYSVWPSHTRYNITLEEINIDLGNVSDTCEYCPIIDKSTTLKIKQLSTDSTATWTAFEGDSDTFGDVTINIEEINANIGPAEPCCEECEDFGLNTTLLYVGDNISIDEYYVQVDDIVGRGTGLTEPFNHVVVISVYNSSGTFIEQSIIPPLDYYIFTVPTGTINVSVCKTHNAFTIFEEWACVNVTYIPYIHPCISNCTNITEPGYYELCNNISTSDFDIDSTACIQISTDNVELNCLGHSINGELDYGSTPISAINAIKTIDTTNREVTNLIIHNCSINNFSSTITSSLGIFVFGNNSSIYNNTISNILVSSTYGGYATSIMGNKISFDSNIIKNSNIALTLFDNTNNSQITNNVLINNSYGIILEGGENNTFNNNSITYSNYSGIVLINESPSHSTPNRNNFENNTICFSNQSEEDSPVGLSNFDILDNSTGIMNEFEENTCDTSYPSGLCDYPCTPEIEPFNCTLIPEMEPVVRGTDININVICERAGIVVDCPEMEWIPNLATAPLPDYYMNPRFDNESSVFNTETTTTSGMKFIIARNITNGTVKGFCTANIQVIGESICNPWIVKLDPGYNAISIPNDPYHSSTSTLFPGLGVWTFNNSINDWQTATEIEAGRGYLIYTDEVKIITIYGEPQDTYDKPLGFSELDNEGWHLVGLSCDNTEAINSLLSETTDHLFHCYNTGTGEYDDQTTIYRGQSCFIIRG